MSSHGTVLITSAAYVGPELVSEFGRLPPCFLPVGNRRLFVLQHQHLEAKFDRIVMSLPADFDIPQMDRDLLARLGISLVFVDANLSLAKSILAAMGQHGWDDKHLSILHGDTLLFDYPYEIADSVSVGESSDYYNWAGVRQDGDRVIEVYDKLPDSQQDRMVLGGYFSFSDSSLFRQCLKDGAHSFVATLDQYTKQMPLRAIPGGKWLDFGHVHTYYSSRCQITTERAFNALSVANRKITKSSSKKERIRAEVFWYENLPFPMRIYAPHFLGSSEGPQGQAYELEYLFLSSLGDLFVFGALPELSWEIVFSSCRSFLGDCSQFAAPPEISEFVMEMYLGKTLDRLEEFAAASGVDIDLGWRINGQDVPSLREMARLAGARIPAPKEKHLSLVHGDLCFSNILFDFRTRSVRVIDPRGQDARNEPSVFGDQRYDLAKLNHSVKGQYDFILAGYFKLIENAPHDLTLELSQPPFLSGVQRAFDRMLDAHFSEEKRAIEGITVLLFLSMLPLHHDDIVRQRALMANAMRMFLLLE